MLLHMDTIVLVLKKRQVSNMQLTYMTVCINTEITQQFRKHWLSSNSKKNMTVLQLQFKALSSYFKIKK